MQMDQETAKKLFQEGGVFIFLGVPEGTEFGIDMKSWNTGEKFRGVKMIPRGLHYIFYSSVSNTGDTAPRTGFFYNFNRSEVLVRKWDNELESISPVAVSEDEVVCLKENILALDSFLGPYPYDILDKWCSLTSNISESLVQKLVPPSGLVMSALELQSCTDADRPRGKKISLTSENEPTVSQQGPKRTRLSSEEEFLPNLKAKPGTELRLTQFPERKYPDGSTPAQITQHSLDSSYVLDTMISKHSEPLEIIGELQFSFICFLVGHSLEAFDHWKKLVILFCSCDSSIKKHRKLYDLFISALEVHIKEIPEEFLADITSNSNFVYVKLKDLFRTIQTSDMDGQLKMKVDRFKKSLTETFLWDFSHLESDDEDEAPVIVEI